MERQNPGPDTGKIELERIINCLRVNHYEFENIEESMYDGCMVANFKKDINYSDQEGNYINDRHIRIKIEFDSDFDYNNTYKDREGDFVFDSDKGEQFIQQLLDNNYDAPRNDDGGYETDRTENLYVGGKIKRKYGRTKKRVINRKKTTRRFRKK